MRDTGRYAIIVVLGLLLGTGAASPQSEGHLRPGSDPTVLPAAVLIADEDNDRIVLVDPQGRVTWEFPQAGDLQPGQVFKVPDDAFYTPDGKQIIVTHEEHQMVTLVDIATRRIVWSYGTPGKSGHLENGTFAGPTNLALDRQGNIYVADTLNYRVQVLDPAGKFLRKFGMQGDRPGEFIRPKGIAVDSEGHIYVADAEFNNFQVFSPEGQPLLAVGVLGSARGQFALIAGLHIDSKDRIYTSEMFGGRIQVFQYIAETGSAKRKGGGGASSR